MTRRLDSIVPHLPAALLLLFSGGAGTFSAGAEARWALAGHLALLIFVGALGSISPDPLRLGRGRLLLVALAVSVLASHLASPVTRAGRLGVVLLPAFVLVPPAVARCWSSQRARRLGLSSVSLVVAAVACWSLFGWWRLGTPGASLPLGHHGLLAAWLLVTLPLAVLPWRDGGVARSIAIVAGVAGATSLLATRSLAAAVAIGVTAVAVVGHWRKGWLGLAILGILGATQADRLGDVLSGADTSVAARWSYLQAAWRGLLERPMLGWGPGASRWTLVEHLQPIPGVHAPEQVVADPHSLPFLVGYELGWSGLLLISGLALAFLRRRPEELVDPGLRRAAFVALAALAVMSCAGRPLAATAIPLAAMIAIGAVLAAETPAPRGGGRGARVIVAAVMATLVVPLDLAHLAYDRAVWADSQEQAVDHLRRAVELDPGFPLYRARLAWLEADGSGARDAAERARGVAALWVVGGMLGQEGGEIWSRDALLRACRLSPLGVIAPYRLTFEDGTRTERVQWTARALLAEPLVSAAVAWRDRGPVLRAAAGELEGLGGVDAGWHAWLEQVLKAREREPGTDPPRVLALAMDGDPATSVSLYAFRRRAWPIDLARIEIDSRLLATIDPGAAAPLSPAAGEIFRDPRCGLGRFL